MPNAPEPCQYPHHRPSDWLHPEFGIVVCGACYPPAPLEVIRRGEPGWNRAIMARREAIAEHVAGCGERGHPLDARLGVCCCGAKPRAAA